MIPRRIFLQIVGAFSVGSAILPPAAASVLEVPSAQRETPSPKRDLEATSFDYYVSNTDVTLPVELVTFDAVVENRQVILTWSTASEVNNAGFEIRRDAGKGWQTLEFIEGVGTTNKPQSYRYVVNDVSPGSHSFRLRQVDEDGEISESEPLVVWVKLEDALRLSPPSPNPVSKYASVTFTVRDEAEVTVALFNVLGQNVATLYSGTPSPSQQQTLRIDGSKLSSGSYFLRLVANGKSVTRRLNIVH